MIAKVNSVTALGYNGAHIEVESDAKAGLPTIHIVGMGNKAIDEARERVRSAITNTSLTFPPKKIVVNLAPAELPKDGTSLDLPIALSILVVSGQLRQSEVAGKVFAGELALDGGVRPIRGVINIVETARRAGFTEVFLPTANIRQAMLVPGIVVIGVADLRSLYLHLKGERIIRAPEIPFQSTPLPHRPFPNTSHPDSPTLDTIVGQEAAKRAVIIACAGHHNLLLTGPPGVGKTMLAHAMTQLLPPLTPEEQIAVTKLHSLAGEIGETVVTRRPFRAPHHTTTHIALIGGGVRPRPGEVSLAHHGVLFLDELPEFQRRQLEALRQPLEDRHVSLARAHGRISYPADFMLIAAMNPCPCGYYGDISRECTCRPAAISAYQQRLSGPLLDRIDMRVTLTRQESGSIFSSNVLHKSQHKTSVEYILSARDRQLKRYSRSYIYNGNAPSDELRSVAHLTHAAKILLESAITKLRLSTRSGLKVLRVARTIADLADRIEIDESHVAEALQFR